MTEGVTATVSARVVASLSAPPPVGQAMQEINEGFSMALLSGVGAGNSDTLFTKELNIAASGSVTIDLSGSVDDAFGSVVALAEVQAFLIIADAANANDIVVGDAASDAYPGPLSANATVAVHPGGVLLMGDPSGWPVTATTADQLKIANGGSGTAVTGKLIIIGRSA